MSNTLSYPGLRCVLEFLDPMKRIHIASRNQSLRTIDKTIPLRIEELEITTYIYCLNLNDHVIDSYIDNYIRFEYGHGKKFKRIWPLILNREEAMKKLLDSYLGARSKIYVNLIRIYEMVSQSSLPLNFIVRINELGCCFSNIDRFPINIDPSSFPLKSLRTVIREPDYLNHPILTSAKILIVVDGIDRVIQLVNQNNTNKRVKFEMSSFRIEDLLSLVRCWKDNGKEIGTTFKFRDYTNNQSVMYFLLQELKEFKIESDHHSSILRVPINRTADIHISHDNGDYIVVEVVPSTLKKESNATEEPCCSKRARHS